MIYAAIIHHSSDLDGYGSAVTAIEWLRKTFNNVFIHTIPINYNSYNIEQIIDKINKKFINRKPTDKVMIFILDFSLSFEELKQIDKICNKLIWIDHHEQSKEIYEKFIKYINENFSELYNNNEKYIINFKPSYKEDPERIGAIGLTYRTLFNNFQTFPTILLAIAYHDVWRFDHTFIKPIISFIQLLPWKDYQFLRKLIFNECIDSFNYKSAYLLDILCTFGKLIEISKSKQIQSMIKYFTFGKLNNYTVAILNNTNSTITSDLLNTILNLNKQIDFSMSYFDNIREGLRVFSLRSLDNKINVGKIAKNIAEKYGMTGGGHGTAAGFALPIDKGIDLVNNQIKNLYNC